MSYQNLYVPQGSLALVLLNVYSSFILKTNQLTAIFDPVKLNLQKPPFDTQNVDAIIITHEHYDHFDEKLVLELEGRSNAIVMTTPLVFQKLEGHGKRVKGLKAGESAEIKDVTFYAEHCKHAANEPLSFIVRTDAATIYNPDDSEPFPEMEEIGNKYKPDIMVYTGTSKRGLIKITELVKPSITISYFDPRLAGLRIPSVELRMISQFEIFRYP